MNLAKEALGKAIVQSYSAKNISLDTGKLKTAKEAAFSNIGGGSVFGLGIGALVLLLLLIPAINIFTLNVAYSRNRAEEIAIRRAFGASRFSAFLQLMFEDLLLVLAGTFIGIILVNPFFEYLMNTFFDMPMLGNIVLISGVDMVVVATLIVPLMILFIFMFGALPAYSIAKRNIADVLKGGMR